MDRQEILEQLLMLVAEPENVPCEDGDYADLVTPVNHELTRLWADALGGHTWLIPEKVREFDFLDFREWIQLSAWHFLFGYLLAKREQAEEERDLFRGAWANN